MLSIRALAAKRHKFLFDTNSALVTRDRPKNNAVTPMELMKRGRSTTEGTMPKIRSFVAPSNVDSLGEAEGRNSLLVAANWKGGHTNETLPKPREVSATGIREAVDRTSVNGVEEVIRHQSHWLEDWSLR